MSDLMESQLRKDVKDLEPENVQLRNKLFNTIMGFKWTDAF